MTRVVPIAHGHVIGSCVKYLPLAGRRATQFILQMMSDRGEPVPTEVSSVELWVKLCWNDGLIGRVRHCKENQRNVQLRLPGSGEGVC